MSRPSPHFPQFDYVTIGHVTRDVIADAPGGPHSQPGGGAFYSALQAARLGLRTLIVTQGVEREIRELLAPHEHELQLHAIEAEHTTTLHTTGAGNRREQRLLAWAGPIERLPALNARIVHLAPIARETPTCLTGNREFVGITPQGLIRSWHGERIETVELEHSRLPAHFDAAAISASEREHCGELLRSARALGAIVAVTHGAHPTTLHTPDPVQTPPPPAQVALEDIGAGDVFAAAFFTVLHEGKPPLEAATFANAAASARIAGRGPQAIATREKIEALLDRPG